MSRRYVLIGVEGNHDQALIGRILQKIFDFSKFSGDESQLEKESLWRKFIPKYPKSGNLYKRLDMPSIFERDDISVAIYVGEGSQLAGNLVVRLSDISQKLDALGIIADADDRCPTKSVIEYHKKLKEIFPDFPHLLSKKGGFTIGKEQVKLGIYILPNNKDQGTLESILIKCGYFVYPEHMERAQNYINQFSEHEIKKIKWEPFDAEKALIATVVSVLKPGKTNTVSITDNKWVSKSSVENIPELKSLVEFLKLLIFRDELST